MKLQDTTMTTCAPSIWQRSLRNLRRHGGNVLLIAPFMALFFIFAIWPALRSAYLSFTDYHATEAPVWIGWSNYVELFNDERFYHALGNTFSYMAMVSVLAVILGLILAMAFG